MTRLLDEVGLDEYTDRFDRDALRYETLTSYDVPSDGDDFARWRVGEPAPAGLTPWGSWVQAQLARDARVRRLRVLYAPPSEYLRFEMEWAYTVNVAAGEDIRVLDLTERARPAGVVDAEFWLLDHQRVALMHYDHAGRFLHADALEGLAAAPYLCSAAMAWWYAEPFTAWWARHPEYHHARV